MKPRKKESQKKADLDKDSTIMQFISEKVRKAIKKKKK